MRHGRAFLTWPTADLRRKLKFLTINQIRAERHNRRRRLDDLQQQEARIREILQERENQE